MLKDIPVPPTCSCDKCKSMCERPCWPTPEEANRLIDNGLGEKLMLDYWETDSNLEFTYILAPASPGREGRTAGWSAFGGCVFQDKITKLCQLHNTGMKPVEGRLASCSKPNPKLHLEVAKTWNSPEGEATVSRWRSLYQK